MQSLCASRMVVAVFDDPNLIAGAGLVPLIGLVEQVGLPGLVLERLAIVDADNAAGASPHAKVMSLVAGMAAGADSIEDVDRLRPAGNRHVFGEMRAPSTLGTFLRAFPHGHVQQLDAVLRASLVALMQRVNLLPGAEQVVFVDRGSTHRDVYGYAKQGAENGWLKGRKTLHPLIATVSTPIARPVVAGTRLRKGQSPTSVAPRGSWPRPWPWSARSPRTPGSWSAATARSPAPTWSRPPPGTGRGCR
jgi:hypothetical protein